MSLRISQRICGLISVLVSSISVCLGIVGSFRSLGINPVQLVRDDSQHLRSLAATHPTREVVCDAAFWRVEVGLYGFGFHFRFSIFGGIIVTIPASAICITKSPDSPGSIFGVINLHSPSTVPSPISINASP